MIDLSNNIIYENLRKSPRYPNEVNREIRYACYCQNCNDFRGYIKLSHYEKKSKLCKKCFCNTKEHKDKIKLITTQYYKTNIYKPCPIRQLKEKYLMVYEID